MTTYAVSKVQLDADGRITAVLWGKVDMDKNAWAQAESVALVAAAVDALNAGDEVYALFPSVNGHVPDRRFVVAHYDDGRKTIVLEGPDAYERDIHDMERLEGAQPP